MQLWMCGALLRASPLRFQIQPSQLNYGCSLEHVWEEQLGENIGNACGIWDPIKNQNKMKVQKSTKELLKLPEEIIPASSRKGKDNNESATGLAQPGLERSHKESSRQPKENQRRTQHRKWQSLVASPTCVSKWCRTSDPQEDQNIPLLQGTVHFPFYFLLGKCEMHIQVFVLTFLNTSTFFFSCRCFYNKHWILPHFSPLFVWLLLHTFSISSLWKPSLLYHYFILHLSVAALGLCRNVAF